ncbi:leucyl/phenylalanyl-tRNA--protein transferase [Sphingobium subterraneum]|uniref:Leucyl/phenylalanyl-tRNA--protein transferase n=1 Tax=Sphingobium subterraneum TaxID=627688 RepID=A0A841J290_9SPHN|nr:leucyl/phenylalanyl-tRNA--protein transferase [Sphingobium subterraneum]MBB6125073.1 leucyl/phenylalanyl-tRNA--protein transferase [Sphingobium subterraneum]
MLIDPFMLLRAYAMGLFPMSDDRDTDEVFWVEPKKRAILPLDGFHLSRSLAKTIRSGQFQVTANRAFGEVVKLCAEAAPDRPTTWINGPIEQSYGRLHELHFAHSVECWSNGALVGGLYGVGLGRAFFGESMFSRATDASKVALAWLVARLRFAGFTLLDCQFMTSHLRSLGAIEMRQKAYLSLLSAAVEGVPLGDAGALFASAEGAAASLAFDPLAEPEAERDVPPSPVFTVSGPVSGQAIAQLLTQTS